MKHLCALFFFVLSFLFWYGPLPAVAIGTGPSGDASKEWACIGRIGCRRALDGRVGWCDTARLKQPITASDDTLRDELVMRCTHQVQADDAPRAYVCGFPALWEATCVPLPKPGGSCPNQRTPLAHDRAARGGDEVMSDHAMVLHMATKRALGI